MLKIRNDAGWVHPRLAQYVAENFPEGIVPGVRTDAAGDTAYLARELEQVSATAYDVLKDPIKGRLFVPFTPVNPGAETFSYDMWDTIGLAEWVSNYGTNPPSVDAFRQRFSGPMRSMWSSYQYSVQDIRQGRMAALMNPGVRSLEVEKARAARRVIEESLDQVIAFGRLPNETANSQGLTGLINNTNIPTVTTTAGAWTAATTPAVLMADLDKLVQTPYQASAEIFEVDTLILPLSVKNLLIKPYSSLNGESVLKVWLAGQDGVSGVRRVDFWKKLNTGSASGGPRSLAYKKSSEVVEFRVAVEYEEFPAQEKNLAFQITCMARVGGVVVRYPLAMAKMDLDA